MPAKLAATLIMGRSGELVLAFPRVVTGKVLSWSGVLLDGSMNPLAVIASFLSVMELRAQHSLMFTRYHTVTRPLLNPTTSQLKW